MAQRKQIKFVFQIGFPTANAPAEAVAAAAVEAASFTCGGCTTSWKTGWWKEGGDKRVAVFPGEVNQEACFELELSCEAHKAERAYTAVSKAIARAERAEHSGIQWVHCSQFEYLGRHFDVTKI